MKIGLGRGLSRALFSAGILAVALPFALISGKTWVAERWGRSADPALWLKAARLEPGDADYWRHLGLYKQWGMTEDGNPQAIVYLQRATRTDPRAPELWMDLGDAYETAGEPARAEEAYEKAQADSPMSADVAWRYGSFFLYHRDFSQGYAQIKRALLAEPSLATSAIAECWQANPDVGALMNQALPAEPSYSVIAMDFFLSRNLLDPALEIWNREMTLAMPVRMPEAIPLVNALIGQNRLTDAEQTWHQALRATRWPRDPRDGSTLVFNGGFERKIVDGGFGWREIPAEGVTYARDSHVSHSGSHSLRIDFGGQANLDFQNVFQLVPVAPRTRYQFSAWLRTEGITTDQGVRFAIFDPQHGGEVQVVTPNTTGTNPWTLVQSDFTTGKDTHLVEIALRRNFTWKFDNKIRGTAWVDDVALAPRVAPAKGAPR